jgi:hypothetical protein
MNSRKSKQHLIATHLSVVQQQYTPMACSTHLTSAQTKGGWTSEDCYVCHGGLHESSCILVWKSQNLASFSAMFMATQGTHGQTAGFRKLERGEEAHKRADGSKPN